MRNTFDPYTWHNNLYFRWTALPVLAHMFSWVTGIGGLVLFPILVTVAQYLILKIHPAVARPGLWFVTLPFTFFIWVKWGPIISQSQPGGIIHGVMAYYAGQLINALFISLIVKKGRPDFLLNWLICTSITALVWLASLWLTTSWVGSKFNNAWSFDLFIIYPAIGLLANGISGYFLLEE